MSAVLGAQRPEQQAAGPSSPVAGPDGGDRGRFRAACSQFPTGVAVVTASSGSQLFGATVNAFASLTVEPPQVLVCLAESSNTWSAIARSGAFAVNLLAADQVALADLFASKDPDKLARVSHERGAVGAPLLSDTVATFECMLVTTAPSATHRVLVGRVMAFASDPSRDPLMFFRSRLLQGPPAGAASSPIR